MREADRAISEAQGFSLSARIIRLLAWHLAEPSASAHGAGAAYRDAEHREIADGLRQLSSTASRGSTEELSEALATLRGNRTLVASRMDAGQLVPVHVRPDSRWASRRLLSLVATCSEAELFAHFEHVIAEYPASGLPRCHRGEVNLWLGHYDAARSDLELVLEKFPHTRWAYIGLATLETIEGKHHRALDTLARGVARMGETSGPGIYGARGEALRKLGRAADAVAPLEQACILSPRRVSAWVNLALAYETLGRVADAQRVFAELVDRAYPLIHDAAGSVDARLDDPSSRVPVLEQALASALGNRSASVITWRVGTGPVRCLTDTTGARTITLARARELQGIRRVLAGRSP
jgi:tetratricopeptide (TPR) repeat protein